MATSKLVRAKQNMSAESLKKLGLCFDELRKLRIWEPEAAQRINDLKDESKDFVDKITEFHDASSEFLKMIQDLAAQVEREKIKALGSSNLLKSMAKQRECQQQQYQVSPRGVKLTEKQCSGCEIRTLVASCFAAETSV